MSLEKEALPLEPGLVWVKGDGNGMDEDVVVVDAVCCGLSGELGRPFGAE
jgi:hypothetical protein